MSSLSEMRSVDSFSTSSFEPMETFAGDRGGLWWHNISFDPETGQGSYLMIMAPGTYSAPHRHEGREEFFVLEGSLRDCDGCLYTEGEFVSLAEGSEHSSKTETGCRLIVTHWGKTSLIEADELECEK
jgi:anti-sigma factor ChrR (cupin superfamily)